MRASDSLSMSQNSSIRFARVKVLFGNDSSLNSIWNSFFGIWTSVPFCISVKESYISVVEPTVIFCSSDILARRSSARIRSIISTSSTGFTMKSSVPIVNALRTSSALSRAVIISTGMLFPLSRIVFRNV